MISPADNKDCYFYGLIPEKNFRFTFVDCSEAVNKIISFHTSVGDSAAELLACTLTGSFLLTDLVKQDTKVSLQLSFFENNPLHSILAYSDRKGLLKGTVRFRSEEDIIDEEDKLEMLGTLKVFRWKEGNCIYQSYITYHSVPFDENLQKYILESEQILSFVKIVAVKENDAWIAKGFILQALPGVAESDIKEVAAGFEKFHQRDDEIRLSDMNTLMETLKNDLNISGFEILDKGMPREQCDCSRERLETVMVSLGKEYLEGVVSEFGFVEFTCEFCNAVYKFDKDDVSRVIAAS